MNSGSHSNKRPTIMDVAYHAGSQRLPRPALRPPLLRPIGGAGEQTHSEPVLSTTRAIRHAGHSDRPLRPTSALGSSCPAQNPRLPTASLLTVAALCMVTAAMGWVLSLRTPAVPRTWIALAPAAFRDAAKASLRSA